MKIKLSQMSVATDLNAADYLMVVQDGVNKKIGANVLFNNMDSSDTIRINHQQNTIDIVLSSKNDANLLILKGGSDRIGVGINAPESKFHVNGNLQVGSASANGVILQSTESLTYTAADATNSVTQIISPLKASTVLNCNTGVSSMFSLSLGFNGQVKTIVQNTIDGGNTSTISVPQGLGFNTITFNAVGDSSILQYISTISKWCIIGGNSVTYSTV